ncbi:hypothetical protein M413DRAFT_116606 [Hebeloma cylindrosporum]|uniref:Uncharacterized protein n=1 Tax=Hebeloma cylindrosporum TaxID=76867 RepID=A0A0C3D078_HEBCY|nr:hypothetical protein M413DRAFT_116606 [Hebeloma cylindrosporum h7]
MEYLDSNSLRPLGDLPIIRDAPTRVSNPHSRWHPRITVYRLLVVSTTISLGSAKAVATFYGKSYVSTTIEWVAGVAVFSLLFMLGWFEESPLEYPKLAWMFDCDLVHFFLGLFKKDPKYTSEGRQLHIRRHDGPHPLITSYRLIVSCSVFTFGMVKAYLSYAGLVGAANVLDWTFGILVTSTLYVLGLYENNPANMMPYFFERHFDKEFYSGRSFFFSIALYLIGLAFTVTFSSVSLKFLMRIHSGVYEDIKPEGASMSFTDFHDRSMMFLGECIWLLPLAGIGYSLYFIREIVSAFGRLTPFRKLARLLRHAFLWIPKTISRQFNTPTWAEAVLEPVHKFFRFVRCFIAHILFFMVATVVWANVAVICLGFPFRTLSDPGNKDPGLVWIYLFRFCMIFLMPGSVLCGLAACIGIIFSIRQVLRPFLQDLDDIYRQKLFLEL